MQLGTRWQTGAPPHRSVPSSLHQAIAAAEHQFPAATSWTLTWLEGRPRCALDEVILVTITPTGAVTSRLLHPMSEASAGAGASPGHTGSATDMTPADDDDDDDWLS